MSGQNWDSQSSGTSHLVVLSVFFIDANTGWVVGGDLSGNGIILKTINGGQGWVRQTSGTSAHLYSVYLTDNNKVGRLVVIEQSLRRLMQALPGMKKQVEHLNH